MNSPKLNGGWAMEREKFSDHAINVFEIAVSDRRKRLELSAYETLRGVRFNSNGAILARLESMFSEALFMSCPGLSIDKALIDAAQSDYWYAREKSYDDESYFVDETEIDDDE